MAFSPGSTRPGASWMVAYGVPESAKPIQRQLERLVAPASSELGEHDDARLEVQAERSRQLAEENDLVGAATDYQRIGARLAGAAQHHAAIGVRLPRPNVTEPIQVCGRQSGLSEQRVLAQRLARAAAGISEKPLRRLELRLENRF